MLDLGVQIDLIWLTHLLQDFLRPMSLLDSKDLVCLCGSDGIGTLDSLQLLFRDERWMRRVSDIDDTRLQEAYHVLCAEAVTDGTNFLRFTSVAERLGDPSGSP